MFDQDNDGDDDSTPALDLDSDLGAGPETDAQTGAFDNALQTVNDALMYGREKHGLAAAMPTRPGDQSESGTPRPRPQPGKLAQNDDGEDDVQSFAEGGAVEDEDQQGDQQGAIPEGDDGESIQDELDRSQPLGNPGDEFSAIRDESLAREKPISGPNEAIGNAITRKRPRVMQYLQASDAAPYDEVAQHEQQADPDGTMSPAQRKLNAVTSAAKEGGKEAAWRVAQSYRKEYDVRRAVAAAAFEAGDIQGGVDNVNKAVANLLDGSNAQFAAAPDGSITATVTSSDAPGNTEPIRLTADDLAKWAAGPSGQYDAARERGLAKSLAPQQQPQQGGDDLRPQASPDLAAQQPGKYRPTPPGYQSPPGNQPDDAIQAQARRIFPMVSQSQKREMWIAQMREQQAKRENDIEKARVGAGGKVEAAGVTAGGRISQEDVRQQGNLGVAGVRAQGGVEREGVKQQGARDVAGTRAQSYDQRTQSNERIAGVKADASINQTLAKIAAQHQDARVRAQAGVLGKQIANVPMGTPLPPQAEQALRKLYTDAGIQAPQGSQAPQPRQPAPAQQQGATPQKGDRREFKQGMGVWDGTKWVPEK